MNKLKVLNKETVINLLKIEGNIITYDTLHAKVYCINRESGHIFGAVRFDTYIKLDLVQIDSYSFYMNHYKLSNKEE